MNAPSLVFVAIAALLVVGVRGQILNSVCVGQTDGTFFSDWNNGCDAYVVCVNENAIGGSCPEGFAFNPVNSVCDLPEEVDCPRTRPDVTVVCPPNTVENFPYPYSCSRYIACISGVQTEIACPTGQHYNVTARICTTIETAQCDIEQSICPIIDNIFNVVFMPSSRSCSRYYFCFGRQTIGLQCAPGLEFDRVAERCDFPENANCVISIPTPRPPPPEIDFQCSGAPNLVREPHPEDCRFYFTCFNGQNFGMEQCPDGLLFDTISRVCQINTIAICLPGTNFITGI